jgi:hypothetical protein
MHSQNATLNQRLHERYNMQRLVIHSINNMQLSHHAIALNAGALQDDT